VAGAVLRLWAIDRLGFNSDEAVYSGQAAAIAGDRALEPFFQVFRAHPLLFQSVLSLGYLAGLDPPFQRVVAVAFGLATVGAVYLLGNALYGRTAGIIAAVLLALMPYHVIVSRQVLLDVPMALFSTLSLYCLTRYALTERPGWLVATGAGLGLTFLSKETSIILVAAVYAFFVLAPEIPVRRRPLLIAVGVMALIVAQFPLALLTAGRTDTGGNYLAWQLFRRANHGLLFYPTSLPQVIGPLVIVAAGLGLWLLRRERTWRETLLLSWIAVPLLFFELYPVKGYQYLLLIAPPVAVLAARALARLPADGEFRRRHRWLGSPWFASAAVAAVVISLAVPSWLRVDESATGKFLAGAGGVPGGREAGKWIDRNVPPGAQVMTIGPSMANVLQFYGHRRAYALSISTNPLNRNPSYVPIHNPDFRIRNNEFQYLVWDSFSAQRSRFFSEGLLRYADRFNGRVVHTESADVQADGGTVRKPLIVIYQVRP
jgi:4-amino-4-deoxy-L-arabinose transferase-like glycosyltransferase